MGETLGAAGQDGERFRSADLGQHVDGGGADIYQGFGGENGSQRGGGGNVAGKVAGGDADVWVFVVQ